MSAGTGIRHSEHNPSGVEDVHFVQMWVLPDTPGIPPGYEQLDISADIASGALVPIASGRPDHGAIRIHQAGATLWGARLAPATRVDLPDDRHVHLFVPTGSGDLESVGRLDTGDAVRVVDPDGLTFTAGDLGADVLVWATV
jgi:hypothetical protein